MTLFRQLRLWLGRAPLPERLTAAVGVALALAVIGWLMIPTPEGSHSSYGSFGGPASQSGLAGGPATGSGGGSGASGTNPVGGVSGAAGDANTAGIQSTAGVAAGTAIAGGTGGTSGASADGGTGATTGRRCISPSGADQGVTSNSIKIAVVVINLGGSQVDTAFGLETPAQQEADYAEVIDSINASGGVACHKIAPVFFQASDLDETSLEQTCLDIEQAGVFAAIDAGAYFVYPTLADCFPENHIPFFTVTMLPQAQQQSFYPYFFSPFSTMEVLYRNTVFALNARGFFSSADGFKKLGFFYRDCAPEVIGEITGWLHQVGLSSQQIVSYDLGCPNGNTSPGSLESAIIKFEQAGVTNVSEAEAEQDFANFTTIAEQQQFRPKYGLGNDGLVTGTSSSMHPDFSNIANAIAITGTREGEDKTPGMSPSGASSKCSAIYQAHGQQPVWTHRQGGDACNFIWMLGAAIEHAPTLQRTSLGAGLHAAGSVQTSFPEGPNDFGGYRVTTGQQFWRTLQFFTSCDCWQVVDRTFHPSYQ